MEHKSNNNYIIAIIVLVVAFFALTYGTFSTGSNFRKLIKKQELELKKLEKTIKEKDSILKAETLLGEQLRYIDSIQVAHLKVLRKRDSINHVTTLKVLLEKQRILSDIELDEKINKIYEDIAHGN
jgi:hypothetical protein